MALPAASVAAGLTTLYLAGGVPAMVVDDYGQIARVTTQHAERAERAADLGLKARLVFAATAADHGTVTVTLTRRDVTADWPRALDLQLIHPTRAERDRRIRLIGADGRYQGALNRPAGRYYVSLSDAPGDWRLTGELATSALELRLVAVTPES